MMPINWFLLITLLLAGCAEEPVVEETVAPIEPTITTRPQPPKIPIKPAKRRVIKVKKGDTLFSISTRFSLHYETLASWNKLVKPYTLYVGQKIKLYDPEKPSEPEVASSVTEPYPTIETTPPAPVNNTVNPISNAKTARTAENTSTTRPRNTPAIKTETSIVSKDKGKVLKLYWKWPIQGKLLKNFVQTGNKGIDIETKVGDNVRAAAGGEVVYSGNGLRAYGNLVIIKHNDVHLSAYANNSALQVREGQKVAQGQIIARCGKSLAGIPSLHFEIRKNGKSVNPLHYLPVP